MQPARSGSSGSGVWLRPGGAYARMGIGLRSTRESRVSSAERRTGGSGNRRSRRHWIVRWRGIGLGRGHDRCAKHVFWPYRTPMSYPDTMER